MAKREREKRIDPENGSGVRMILGLVIGLMGLPAFVAFIDRQGVSLEAVSWLGKMAASEDKTELFVVAGVIALGIMAIGIVFKRILRLDLMIFMLVGGFLWVPFGNHIHGTLPNLEAKVPEWKPRLDGIVAVDPRLTALRRTAETWWVPPGQDTAAAATAAPPTTDPEQKPERAPIRLPQIGR